MKTRNLFRNVFAAAFVFFAACITGALAAQPLIEITYIPPTGEAGMAEGRVVWDELTAENAGQYAVIAILRASSNGWRDDYVKPTYESYLNPVDASGSFFINIITSGNDVIYPNYNFYFVRKETFAGVGGGSIKAHNMTGRYLGEPAIVDRNTFWNIPRPPVSDMRPGFVAAGTVVTLSSPDGGNIRYTLDGSDPVSSPSAKTYSNDALTVPPESSLLVKAVTEKDGAYSFLSSLLWISSEPYTTPLFGLNVSLALNGESMGQEISEEETATRMAPIASITKWIRTFGTVGNGLPYINKIAKSAGLRTMIGLYISDVPENNAQQLQGLRKILETGPAPDLIAVGNETVYGNISPSIVAECIDAVREILKEFNLVLPVGSVDTGGASWTHLVMSKLDFVGINLYDGTWNNIQESRMLDALKQSYDKGLASFASKCVLITETGTPYKGAPYNPPGFSTPQTPSENKAKAYLKGVSEWSKENYIPLFYFEAYDEPVKSSNGGHEIEQYFGLMNGQLEIHPFYKSVTGSSDAALSSLTVSAGTLSFNPSILNYTVNVSHDVTEISVTGVANHRQATVEGNVTGKSLNVGNNEIKIKVTAENGTATQTCTVTVIRAGSSDAALSGLTVSAGTLPFNPSTLNYTVNVSHDVTEISVTGVANHRQATVEGNVTGKSLNVGNSEIKIKVTAEDGTATQTYTVTVIRADHIPVTEANLVSVAVNGNQVDINNLKYVAGCGEDSFVLDLQTSPYSAVTVNGSEYNPSGHQINFADDASVNIRIQAETGGAENSYRLDIVTPANGNSLYFQRWSDIVAINKNPANNGGYNVSEIRWYRQDGTFMSDNTYIQTHGGPVSDYYAEILTDNVWRRVCGIPETRAVAEITVFPNPVPHGESLKLQIPDVFIGGALKIYSINGTLTKTVLPLSAIYSNVDVSNLSSGIYLLHVSGRDESPLATKIIIE
jgi:exo-beta-1,3-glucanase (GH17 family)